MIKMIKKIIFIYLSTFSKIIYICGICIRKARKMSFCWSRNYPENAQRLKQWRIEPITPGFSFIQYIFHSTYFPFGLQIFYSQNNLKKFLTSFKKWISHVFVHLFIEPATKNELKTINVFFINYVHQNCLGRIIGYRNRMLS